MVMMHEFLKVKRELYERASKQIKREWQRWVYKRLPGFLHHIWKCCYSHKCCIHILWDIWTIVLHEDMEKSNNKHTTSIFQIRRALRRADLLWCYCVPPSHWHGATSNPCYLLFWRAAAIRTLRMCIVIKHLWYLHICLLLSSLPWHLFLIARFIPSPMWTESRFGRTVCISGSISDQHTALKYSLLDRGEALPSMRSHIFAVE